MAIEFCNMPLGDAPFVSLSGNECTEFQKCCANSATQYIWTQSHWVYVDPRLIWDLRDHVRHIFADEAIHAVIGRRLHQFIAGRAEEGGDIRHRAAICEERFQRAAGWNFLEHLCLAPAHLAGETARPLTCRLMAVLSWQTPSFSVFLRIVTEPQTFARVSLAGRSAQIKAGPINLLGSIGGLWLVRLG